MSKPVVLLDPGHGGHDPGAVYNGLKEKDLNLNLALKVAERLKEVKVLLTRERDSYLSLAERVAMSKRAEPDLFLSLHANAGGGRGFESFISSGVGSSDPSVTMQKVIHKNIMAALGRWQITDRGLKRASFYVLKYNPYPAVLIESLFIDNLKEANLWREPLFSETLATAVAKGVREALGVAVKEAAIVASGNGADTASQAGAAFSPQVLYTVQVGAFAYIENARQRLTEAKRAGFNDAYIYQKQV